MCPEAGFLLPCSYGSCGLLWLRPQHADQVPTSDPRGGCISLVVSHHSHWFVTSPPSFRYVTNSHTKTGRAPTIDILKSWIRLQWGETDCARCFELRCSMRSTTRPSLYHGVPEFGPPSVQTRQTQKSARVRVWGLGFRVWGWGLGYIDWGRALLQADAV